MSSSVNLSFSPFNDQEAMLLSLLKSESRRIVLLDSLPSQILPEFVPSTTTTVLPIESSTFKPLRSQPVESLPRRIVLLRALSDMVKSEQSPVVVSKSPTEKDNTQSPGLSGVKVLTKLASLSNAKLSESSSTLLYQTTSSLSEVTEASDTNQRTEKSLQRRIVLPKALSEDLITPGVSKHLIQKKFKILQKPASVSKEVSASKSFQEDAPSTNTPSRPIKPTPTVLPIVSTVRAKSPENPAKSLTTRSPVQVSTLTLRVKSTEDPTQYLTTRSPVQVTTPSILLTRRLPSVDGKEQEVLKTVSESSPPAREVIEIEVDVGGVEIAKVSSPIFFSRTPYREVASFHSLSEGGVELVTVEGRTLARSSSGGRIPVRESLPAGLTRTLKVTPVFITRVGRGRFF